VSALQLEPDLVVLPDGTTVPGPIVVDGDAAVLGSRADAQRVPLPGRVLVPGLINAHSHAFQRSLRGKVEHRSLENPDDDFWTWRKLMYETANAMSLDDVEAVATLAYREMVASGFTAVGEFHYVHHDEAGAPYGDPAAVPRRLARAAERAGLRLVLLLTAYERAGPGAPPTEGQRRFVFDTPEAFLAHARAVRAALPDVDHGLAIHSVRACGAQMIAAVAAEAEAEDLPLHVHACEQTGELEICRAEHGVAPIALLESLGALTARTVVVHGTHLEPDDPGRLAKAGAAVCICPSTERNLGDGLCPIADLAEAGVSICVGTDQHARIDAVDELRSLEDHERLRLRRRNVLTRPGEGLAEALIPRGTVSGRAALGLADAARSGDWVAIEAPTSGGIDAILVGGSGRDVTDVFVRGARVYRRP
jgi:formimidoylglutamate deiminase